MKFKQSDLNNKEGKIKLRDNYKPKKLAFNFSFLTRNKKYNFQTIDKATKAKILDKMAYLSSEDFVIVASTWPKEKGIEKLNESEISISMHPDFFDGKREKFCDDYFWVFRLSKKGRVVGKLLNNIFIVVGIETTFDSYKHS